MQCSTFAFLCPLCLFHNPCQSMSMLRDQTTKFQYCCPLIRSGVRDHRHHRTALPFPSSQRSVQAPTTSFYILLEIILDLLAASSLNPPNCISLSVIASTPTLFSSPPLLTTSFLIFCVFLLFLTDRYLHRTDLSCHLVLNF